MFVLRTAPSIKVFNLVNNVLKDHDEKRDDVMIKITRAVFDLLTLRESSLVYIRHAQKYALA
jgi:hypothetical protein